MYDFQSFIPVIESMLTTTDVSAVMGLGNYEQIGKFFGGFLVLQT